MSSYQLHAQNPNDYKQTQFITQVEFEEGLSLKENEEFAEKMVNLWKKRKNNPGPQEEPIPEGWELLVCSKGSPYFIEGKQSSALS